MGALAYPGRGATRRQLDRKPGLPNDLDAMDENDTPETDAAECDASELYGDDSSGPSGYVPIEAAQKLELERDRYKEKLAEFMAIADEFAESRRGVTRFLVLADEIEEGFPELAIGRFNGDDDSE